MKFVESICVYCGSSAGADPEFAETARKLGTLLAAEGIRLIYGGAMVGLMGIVADAVMASGGHTIGVIPTRLRDRELAHGGLSELIVVDTMHDRKRVMAEHADAFAVLPGGLGTLDETFEIVTWRLLGMHDKSIYLVNIADYWQPLIALFDQIVAHRFAAPFVPRLVEVVPDVNALMDAISAREPG